MTGIGGDSISGPGFELPPVGGPSTEGAEGGTGVTGPGTQDTISSGGGPQTQQVIGADISDGRITIAEFARVIQTAIDEMEQTQELIESSDIQLDKKYKAGLSSEIKALRDLYNELQEAAENAESAQQNVNSQTGNINTIIAGHNAGLSGEKQAINAYNQAVSEYNNPSSPHYHDNSYLQNAVNAYNAYAESRNSEIDAYNAQIEAYNATIDAYNESLEVINEQRQEQNLPPLPLQPTIPLRTGSMPTGVDGTSALGSPASYGVGPSVWQAPTTQVVLPDVREVLETYFYPIFDQAVGNIRDFITNIERSGELNLEKILTFLSNLNQLPEILVLQLMTTALVTNYSENVTQYGLAVASTTLKKIFSNSLLAALGNKSGIGLSPNIRSALELAALSLIGKAAVYAAGLPSLAFLGDRLSRLGLSRAAMALALSFSFVGRMSFFVSKNTLENSIMTAVNEDPNLTHLSQEEKKSLASDLTNAAQLGILHFTTLNVASALGVPGLLGQVMFNALNIAGLSPSIHTIAFSDMLNNTSVTSLSQAIIASALIDKGYSESDAASIVGAAVTKAIESGPYASANEFVNQLTHQLSLNGVNDYSVARSLALDFTAHMMATNPSVALGGTYLDAQVSLGMIDKNDLFTASAISAVLTGDLAGYNALYTASINALYGLDFAGGTVRDVVEGLYGELQAQGVPSGDAWQIATNFGGFLRDSDVATLAFSANPLALGLLHQHTESALIAGGVDPTDAKNIAQALDNIALSNPGILTGANIVNQMAGAIGFAQGVQRGAALYDIANVLAAESKWSGDAVNNAASAITSALFANPGAFGNDAALKGAIRDALLGIEGLGLSATDAVRLADQIASGNMFTEQYVQNAVLGELVNQGLPTNVAEALSSSIASEIGVSLGAAGGPESAFSNALSSNPYVGSAASSVVDAVSYHDVINTEAIEKRLANSLVESGYAKNEQEANALASSIAVAALSNGSAYASDTSLNLAISSTASQILGIEPSSARDLVVGLTLTDVVQRDVLVDQLTQGYMNSGITDMAIANQLAVVTAEGVIRNTVDQNVQQSFQNAGRDHLYHTLGVPIGAAIELSRQVDFENSLIIDTLRDGVTEALVNAGSYSHTDALNIANDVLALVLLNPLIYLSPESFQTALADTLTVALGVERNVALEVGTQVNLDGIVNREAIKDAIKIALVNAGYSQIDADALSIKASETFLLIGSTALDLPDIGMIAHAVALAQSFGVQDLQNALTTSFLGANLFVNANDAKEITEQIANAVFVNPLAFTNSDGFRQVLIGAIIDNVGTVDLNQAEAIANQLVITDAIRVEILKQAIIHAGSEHGFF